MAAKKGAVTHPNPHFGPQFFENVSPLVFQFPLGASGESHGHDRKECDFSEVSASTTTVEMPCSGSAVGEL